MVHCTKAVDPIQPKRKNNYRMKKIIFLSLFALTLPGVGVMAQSNDDDLYFTPSKTQVKPGKDPRTQVREIPMQRNEPTAVQQSNRTTVVVQDRQGNARDVDEYNRRFDVRDNEFELDGDTLFVRAKKQSDLDGEWVNGEFNGTQDDYEYAERIIRFRNPRYAISISSPYYWDVVYGANSWDWNVYTDGFYAYAFPTFSNRLWWDWRYNSYGHGWGYPYSYGYMGSWYGGYWGNPYGYYGGFHGGYYPGYYGGWGGHYAGWGGGSYRDYNRTYTNRRSTGQYDSNRRSSYSAGRQDGNSVRRSTPSGGRVVGTRESSRVRSSSEGRDRATRVEGSGSRSSVGSSREGMTRRGEYTRPSSTRSSGSESVRRESARSSSGSSGTYRRGSSTNAARSSSSESRSRSYNSNSSSRSYSPSSSSGSSRSSGSFSGGGSSRSGGGSSSSRSGGRR